LFLTLLLTYALGVLASRWLVLRAFALDAPTIAAMAAVPVVQAAVLLAWRRWSAGRRP
jgi:hypothetical protein